MTCTHPHRSESACCPLHFIAGGFAIPAADDPTSPGAISFEDATPKEPSTRCNADRSATEGLYERLGPGQLLVIRNARVITMVGEEVLDGRDVFVRDARVESVQPTGSILPDDAVIIDATGKTLIPGLTEIHGHIFTVNWAKAFAQMVEGSEDASEYVLPYDLMLFVLLANGITRLEIMAGCPDTLWMRDSVRNGSLVGPTFRVGSPLIDGPAPMHSPLMNYRVGDHAGGKRAAGEIARMGFDFAKPYSMLPAEGYEGLVEGCRELGIPLMGHVPTSIGVSRAIALGQGGIAHAAELFYWEQEPARSNAARIAALTSQMAEAGTWLQATVIVGRNSEDLSYARTPPSPDRQWMNPLQKAFWADNSLLRHSFENMPHRKQLFAEAAKLSYDVTRSARGAGVRVLTGTDFPNPFVVEGFSLHEELQALVDHCDFSPREALFASTRLAAQYHGDAEVDGTVQPGAAANLVILDANPLDDISATRGVHAIVAQNALLRQPTIEDGWRRVRAAYEAMGHPTIELPATP